jgi:ABC-2 type transport system permease protein
MRFHASLASAGVAILGLVVAMLLFAAIGVGLAGLVVVFKANLPVSNFVTTGLSLLGGVYYPISLLPGPLHVVGEILPFTWALEVLRSGLLQHQILWGELALLAGVTVILVPGSLWAFTRAVARSRRTGTLGQY